MIVIHRIPWFALGLAYACFSSHPNCEACRQGVTAVLIRLSYVALTSDKNIFRFCLVFLGNSGAANFTPVHPNIKITYFPLTCSAIYQSNLDDLEAKGEETLVVAFSRKLFLASELA